MLSCHDTLPRFPTMSDVLTSISSFSEEITTIAPKWKPFCIFNYTKLNLAKDVRRLERELIAHTGYHERATLESIHGLFETCLELVKQYCLNPTMWDYAEALDSLQYWIIIIQDNPNGPPKYEILRLLRPPTPPRPSRPDGAL